MPYKTSKEALLLELGILEYMLLQRLQLGCCPDRSFTFGKSPSLQNGSIPKGGHSHPHPVSRMDPISLKNQLGSRRGKATGDCGHRLPAIWQGYLWKISFLPTSNIRSGRRDGSHIWDMEIQECRRFPKPYDHHWPPCYLRNGVGLLPFLRVLVDRRTLTPWDMSR